MQDPSLGDELCARRPRARALRETIVGLQETSIFGNEVYIVVHMDCVDAQRTIQRRTPAQLGGTIMSVTLEGYAVTVTTQHRNDAIIFAPQTFCSLSVC